MSLVSDKKIISIVISYNDKTNTSLTVDSLLNQTMPTKIVVWDNGSSDGTVEELKFNFGTDIIVHENPANFFWTPAINCALETYYDQEDIIHYSNNDIYYPQDSIKRMVEDLYEKNAGAVGPVGLGLPPLQNCLNYYPEYVHGVIDVEDLYKKIESKEPIKISSIAGACMVMKASNWRLIGPLDTGMPLGADDFDYSIRIKNFGLNLYASARSFVSHRGHASGNIASREWAEMGARSWDFFNKKWNGYYYNEKEAVKCMWGHEYHEGWDYGTGWMDPDSRIEVWKKRESYTKHMIKEIPSEQIPIIIISRDRVSYLSKLINWLEKAGHQNIIICDNQSQYEPMLEYLRNTNHTVFNSDINSHLSPWQSGLVEKYGKYNKYVITDCDILPTEDCPLDVVSFFSESLEKYANLHRPKIGLSLKIDDLPDHYINKQKVERWESQFWGRLDDHFFNAPIDTTFALYVAGADHDVSGLRSAPPYSARHLPWYSNSSNLTDEEVYYFSRADESVATWTNQPVKESHVI